MNPPSEHATPHAYSGGDRQRQRYNRPGQPALSYRLGTHATFVHHLLERLSRQAIPDGPHQGTRPLADLTTRRLDDPSIALIDAWATVADVLTFYQERIANEGYFNTATERRSILELAHAIGYELNPGVAASTFLAFTVEDAPGSPRVAVVSQGDKVQSLPDQGQLPQMFETIETRETRAEWNVLRPRLNRPQVLELDADHFYVTGNANTLAVGQLLLVAVNIESRVETRVKRIEKVSVETTLGRTRIDLVATPTPPPPFAPAAPPDGVIDLNPTVLNAKEIVNKVLERTWRERNLKAFLDMKHWVAKDLLTHLDAPSRETLTPVDAGLFVFGERLGFFGHNAPHHGSLPLAINVKGDPFTHPWDNPKWEIWRDSLTGQYYGPDADVYLERSVRDIHANSWVVFEGPDKTTHVYRVNATHDTSLTGFALGGQVTGLSLSHEDGTDLTHRASSGGETPPALHVRTTAAHIASGPLILADAPITEALEPGATSLMLDRMVLDLHAGQPLALSGEQADAAGVTRHEVVILADSVHQGGYTILHFTRGLTYGYHRDTVTLNANVVRATHGETVREVLGNGDGAQINQRFVLQRAPLTYTSAPTPSGAKSTLSVRVNGVLWHEVPSLYNLPANSQSYIVRHADDGTTTLIFGDGIHGARLPSGQDNVVATYRSGIGPQAEVDAGSLTLLQSRPLGIREVSNPLPASGAAAPESRNEALTHAPLTVLTLDRIVSLLDFEHFAQSFAGIGKAQAIRLWTGETDLLHLTIAAANGSSVDANSDLFSSLIKAINAVREPTHDVRVSSFQPVYFNVEAKILVDPRHLSDTVLAAVESALQTAFAFETRAFGQTVTAAEIVTVMQRTPGVVAVDLDRLYRATDDVGLHQVLTAAIAHLNQREIEPAQLLLLNPAGVSLKEMTP